MGTPCYADFNLNRYAAVLDKALEAGQRIYSAAYIMPSGSGEYEDARKHRSHLKLLKRMMTDQLPRRLAQVAHDEAGVRVDLAYPMIGDFLAYQYVTDINYSAATNFTEMDFVVRDRGSRRHPQVLHKPGRLSEADIIRWVAEHQERECGAAGHPFRALWGRPFS